MGAFNGKLIADGTITLAKLVSSLGNALLQAGTAVAWTVDQNAGGQKLTNLGAPVSGTDGARLQDVQNIPFKQVVRAATTANITLSGAQTIDAVSVVAGDRVLVKNQTTQSGNGIYLCASGAWTRTVDADSTFELNACVIMVGDEGTANAGKRFAQTTANPTIGSSSIVFVDIGTGTSAGFPTASNKAMAASLTTADNQIACATTIAATPANHSYVRVFAGGIAMVLGDGAKTKDCYFSADSGATAKSIATIASGDSLYWVGSVAGFQLATTDLIDFDYAV
jgi:hypothetical protein